MNMSTTKYCVITEGLSRDASGDWYRDGWTAWDTTRDPVGSEPIDQFVSAMERDEVDAAMRADGFVVESADDAALRLGLVVEQGRWWPNDDRHPECAEPFDPSEGTDADYSPGP